MRTKIFNLIGYAGVLLVNGLANSIPIGGKTTGEVSDLYQNLFVPAGYTFSIWGLIYLSLLLYVLYPFLKKDELFNNINSDISPIFLGTCLVNMTWIFLWHNLQILFTWLLMIVFLFLLIFIYLRLRQRSQRTALHTVFLDIPFSLYLGWISVATIANSSALLIDLDMNSYLLPEQVWLVIMVSIAFVLGIVFLNRFHDTVIVAVLIWAFMGIYSNLNSGMQGDMLWSKAPLILAITIGIFTIWRMVRKERFYLYR